MNLIKTSENESMTCFVDIDALESKRALVKLIELVDLKQSMTSHGGLYINSYRIIKAVNLEVMEEVIIKLEAFSEPMGMGGWLWTDNIERFNGVIPNESLRFKTIQFLKKNNFL